MVTIQTATPRGLLASIRQAIDTGHVVTWTYDKDGDFTHTPDQWRSKAWLRPQIADGALTLSIIWNVPNRQVYAVYEGRFIEMILAHFNGQFSYAWAN